MNITKKKITNKALISASACFLNKALPEDWEDFNGKQLLQYIQDHRVDNYQEVPPERLLNLIQELSVVFIKFYLELTTELSEDIVMSFAVEEENNHE